MRDELQLVVISLISTGICIAAILVSQLECERKYADFSHRWGFWEGCRIQQNNKWIPADSYYFKEEVTNDNK